MPNWADDEGRYYYTPKGKSWQESVQIPHPPVSNPRGCNCICCFENAAEKDSSSSKEKEYEFVMVTTKVWSSKFKAKSIEEAIEKFHQQGEWQNCDFQDHVQPDVEVRDSDGHVLRHRI